MTDFKSTILITGGTSGLGFWLAHDLALTHRDSQIILASRTDKSNAAAKLTNLLTSAGHRPPPGA